MRRTAAKPVVIADTQDNPGVGGDSNTMGMVRALLRHGARDAAVGIIWDEHAARAAHRAGVNARIRLALGGGSNVAGDSPLEGEFEVEHLSDGRFRFDGLPDGTFVLCDERPWLVRGDTLVEWTPAGYGAQRRARPRGAVAVVLTPPSLVEVLRSDWAPATVPDTDPRPPDRLVPPITTAAMAFSS